MEMMIKETHSANARERVEALTAQAIIMTMTIQAEVAAEVAVAAIRVLDQLLPQVQLLPYLQSVFCYYELR
jgi:hypothetical protein